MPNSAPSHPLSSGFEELRKDNRTVALMLAGILIGISVVIQSGVAGLANAIGAIFA